MMTKACHGEITLRKDSLRRIFSSQASGMRGKRNLVAIRLSDCEDLGTLRSLLFLSSRIRLIQLMETQTFPHLPSAGFDSRLWRELRARIIKMHRIKCGVRADSAKDRGMARTVVEAER